MKDTLLKAEDGSYHDIVVFSVADDHAPAIVIGGVMPWQTSYVLSPAAARALAAELLSRAAEFEVVQP
jgi:hypothetical protein